MALAFAQDCLEISCFPQWNHSEIYSTHMWVVFPLGKKRVGNKKISVKPLNNSLPITEEQSKWKFCKKQQQLAIHDLSVYSSIEIMFYVHIYGIKCGACQVVSMLWSKITLFLSITIYCITSEDQRENEIRKFKYSCLTLLQEKISDVYLCNAFASKFWCIIGA